MDTSPIQSLVLVCSAITLWGPVPNARGIYDVICGLSLLHNLHSWCVSMLDLSPICSKSDLFFFAAILLNFVCNLVYLFFSLILSVVFLMRAQNACICKHNMRQRKTCFSTIVIQTQLLLRSIHCDPLVSVRMKGT